ncbi:gliding motility protein GldL [Aureisphaera galaxeae]|uniref:type IX secretion system motor protein PorL/GldL n=1 Tax=Aureisphaera galaxeae TaxID=1538023 RepID=UPI00235102DA|nr:gliding motility protein GldL [Aureisphaera galaxeae]MDC8003082.1 gliding motility protein GldL [Aureisphaera galaxeae]
MAQSKSSKKLFNMAYGLGASIVILGALFKILHWELGPLNGGLLLAIGLITEAIIFAISAFEPVDDDLDWSLVYPELAGGKTKDKKEQPKDPQGILSQKLDEMLKEAKIDGELMSSLGESIRSFEGAAKGMAPTAEAMNSTKKYSEEMALAAAQMESLNSLYKVQVESTSRQAEVNEQVVENAAQLKAQMEHLASNLSSLNGVYGGMLSAMNRN